VHRHHKQTAGRKCQSTPNPAVTFCPN
jgi:hypothetical protein